MAHVNTPILPLLLLLLIITPDATSFVVRPSLNSNLVVPSRENLSRSLTAQSKVRLLSSEVNETEPPEQKEYGLLDPSSRPPNPLAPLNEIELSAQRTALGSLESSWRMQREREEYEAARLLGWTKQAETYNGRFAMFFLVVGLLTEYWTGVSLPGQIEEMLRVAGVIDMS
mmetsp:Transcript_19845/g.39712  ORF Transcript_19845/g.39712 Transcript_19845/m.39712 type:complete len:171 (-) Transcript_19845:156-668(-)|eukprot:CAMPEP_0182453796 /NCGR_PEP_ID=MMETSP1319-20130603/704_1 /TAXON_ID=172717 /ORGANISM="Bolidomonas pacifica, Strain RCC208" /LENGTH=170 /DNA_ID=CAMNT_0024651751 /DNA_START=23 /DNA_END=535 /DNA_ORIENTATION=+